MLFEARLLADPCVLHQRLLPYAVSHEIRISRRPSRLRSSVASETVGLAVALGMTRWLLAPILLNAKLPEVFPQLPRGHGLGSALSMQRNRGEAITELREALKLRPNNPEAQEMLQRLEQ